MVRLGVLVCALVCVAATPLAVVVSQEEEVELRGRIAFTSNEDNNPGDIYVVDADGTNRIRLTNDIAYDGHPSWSPDGEEIAFWSTRGSNLGDIYTMQSNGQGIMRLTRHPARDALPAWSPDGERIAFVSMRDDNRGDIYVVNTDGTETMRLTNRPELETSPCWSADGSQIAFTRVREGVSARVYVVPASGGTPHQLVTADGWSSDPTWSPTINELAFVLTKGSSNWGDIWFADALEGAILRRFRYQGRESGLTWSPDGSMICCSHSRRPNGEKANLIIFQIEGSEIFQVTKSDAIDREPDWWGEETP